MKNHDEIMNILKRYLENNISRKKIIFVFQNKTIFNDNNHVCLNWITYYDDAYLIYLSKKKQLIFKIISKKKITQKIKNCEYFNWLIYLNINQIYYEYIIMRVKNTQ